MDGTESDGARGAAWRRWEPHIHTPSTALSDSYGCTTLPPLS